MECVNSNLTEVARAGSENLSLSRTVDIHCHCLPGIDDGPNTMSESLALCQALVKDGITTAIATPHQLGRFSSCNQAGQIREKVLALNKELQSNGIALTVMPGADVRVDERICQLLKADEILTLADSGRYILLELPHQVFIDIEPLLVELSCVGVQAIISHPERHPVLSKQSKVLLKWVGHAAHMQITAASLLGEFGQREEEASWRFLSSGLALIVATDCHNSNSRRPRMKAAFEQISVRLGPALAQLVCVENPLRVLRGQDMAHISLFKSKDVEYGRVPSHF